MEYSVLVVDDQPENIKLITHILKEMDLGRKIYAAPNGKIALQLAVQIIPDIILSDWEMPEMNGLELLRNLKKLEETKDIPFIMISAVKIDAASMKDSFEAGVHDYLKKPFDKLEFIARVRATLKLHDAYLRIKKDKEEMAEQAMIIARQHDQLEKLNVMKDKIFSIISHDVRAPLATLDGLLQIFNDDQIALSEEELKECTATVQLELNKIQFLMDNLLLWAKSQLANKEVLKSDCNLYQIVDDTLKLFENRIYKKNLKIENTINKDQMFYVDNNLISFVIRNLIANAVKFTRDSGTITVRATYEGTNIKVEVIDTGIGMTTNTLSQLFKDRISLTQVGTAGEEGTGLGLMLCKDMLENAGGTIAVKSSVGEGSTFSFNLPGT
ncbi:response regulator [Aquimarina sp. 2-A2]|uniref:hybrid sensor histidine kinase/response regulator n=1 Tax=Aquimarina sp. 2-A2 TaxID=3382644 RepID=UPI00387F28EE